jgi:hypothetical protein
MTDPITEILVELVNGYIRNGQSADYNQAHAAITEYIEEIIGPDEPVAKQHYYAGDIEERTAFPDRRNRLRNEQRKRLKGE